MHTQYILNTNEKINLKHQNQAKPPQTDINQKLSQNLTPPSQMATEVKFKHLSSATHTKATPKNHHTSLGSTAGRTVKQRLSSPKELTCHPRMLRLDDLGLFYSLINVLGSNPVLSIYTTTLKLRESYQTFGSCKVRRSSIRKLRADDIYSVYTKKRC